MKMTERIKDSAARRGLTLSQVEQLLGFGPRTIYKWDKNFPSVDKVLAVANLLHVPLYWLVTGTFEDLHQPLAERFALLSETDKEKVEHFIEISLTLPGDPSSPAPGTDAGGARTTRVPVLGRIDEQFPSSGIHCLGYATCSLDADYALIMGDSSMEPLIMPEEYVFLKNEQTPANGDILVLCRDQRLFCRQYSDGQDHILLRPLNRKIEDETLAPEEFDSLEIIGKILLDQRQQDSISLFLAGII